MREMKINIYNKDNIYLLNLTAVQGILEEVQNEFPR